MPRRIITKKKDKIHKFKQKRKTSTFSQTDKMEVNPNEDFSCIYWFLVQHSDKKYTMKLKGKMYK